MDITIIVGVAFMVGFILGLVAMNIIIEVSFWRESKRRDKSMLDFAEYVSKRRNKRINFDLFAGAGGSFDE